MNLRELIPCLAFAAGLAAAQPAVPATLLVTSPQFGVCVTSEDAKYQYSWGALRPETGLFSYFLPGQAPLEPKIDAPQAATPGGLVRVEVQDSEEIDSLTAQILGPKQRTVSAGDRIPSFAVAEGQIGSFSWESPAVTARGSYTLSLTVKAGDRSAMQLSPFSVGARTFRFEQIAMTEGMEELRTSDSPRKLAEARELIRTITTPHADALFETGMLRNPLPDARRTSGYGDRRKYMFPDDRSDYSVHEALTLPRRKGHPFRPAGGDGGVARKGWSRATRWSSSLLPGLYALYSHLSEIDVKAGGVVGHGDMIGKMEMTGFPTGPHLHWGIDALGVPGRTLMR